jgi:hypothetical protein
MGDSDLNYHGLDIVRREAYAQAHKAWAIYQKTENYRTRTTLSKPGDLFMTGLEAGFIEGYVMAVAGLEVDE